MAVHRLAGELGLSGKVGPVVICRRGKSAYMRQHTVPRNPKTPKQKTARSHFREAIDAWKALPAAEKRTYRDRAACLGRTGYNLFVSEHLGGKQSAAAPSASSPAMAPREVLAACLEAVLRLAAEGRTDVLRLALEALNAR